jgi:glycosyltransferase involved in cell wall biosynthesis
MNILHVVPTYLPATRYGGPIYSVHGLCRALAARGHQVHVFTTNVDGPRDSDVPLEKPVDVDGVRVWYFPSRWGRRLYWSPAMGKELARRIRDFEMVHLHSVFLWPTLAAARAARAAAVPYALSPRGMLVRNLIHRKSRWLKTAWIALVERRNLERAAAIHVTSAAEAGELQRFGLQLPPVWEVPNGIDEPAAWSSETVSPAVAQVLNGTRFMLVLGRVSWKKGIDRALRALPQAPDALLVIAGNDEEGYTPRLRALAADLGVDDRVRFVGPVSGADKEALLCSTAALLLPSYSESFGNVVLEALIRGRPVVVTPEVGAAAVVEECGGGIVVPGEPQSLGAAIASVLARPEDMLVDPERKARVLDRYRWACIAEQMEARYVGVARSALAPA